MSNKAHESNTSRIIKLSACAIATLVGFGVVFINIENSEEFDYGIQGVCWAVIYISMAVVISDVLNTIEKGRRSPWVLGVLFMPIITIPYYIATHGKRDAL